MTRYAANTTVAADKTRREIESALSRWGANAFMYGWQNQRAVLAFEAHRRQIRFELPMPDRNDREFTHTPSKGQRRSAGQVEQMYDQAVRARWRALLLIIKAKLEAIESGITSFEDEFLAHTVIASGATVSDWLQPQIAESYESGAMPPMLPQPQTAIEAGHVYEGEVV